MRDIRKEEQMNIYRKWHNLDKNLLDVRLKFTNTTFPTLSIIPSIPGHSQAGPAKFLEAISVIIENFQSAPILMKFGMAVYFEALSSKINFILLQNLFRPQIGGFLKIKGYRHR